MLALGAEHGGLGAHLAPVPAVQCTVQYSTMKYSTVPAGAGHAELRQVEVRGVAAAGVDVDPGPREHGHGGAAGGQVPVDLQAALQHTARASN